MCNARLDILSGKMEQIHHYLVNRIREVSDANIKSELAQVLSLLPQEIKEKPAESKEFVLGFEDGYYGRDWKNYDYDGDYMRGVRAGMTKYRQDELEMKNSREVC